MAVGRRLARGLDRDHAAAAGPVLHQHLLAEDLADLLAIEARRRIGAAAGIEGYEDADRPVGEAACLRLRRQGRHGQQRCGEHRAQERGPDRFHRLASVLLMTPAASSAAVSST